MSGYEYDDAVMSFLVLHNKKSLTHLKKKKKKLKNVFQLFGNQVISWSCGRMGAGGEESFRAAGWCAEWRIFNLQDFCLVIMIFIFNLF